MGEEGGSSTNWGLVFLSRGAQAWLLIDRSRAPAVVWFLLNSRFIWRSLGRGQIGLRGKGPQLSQATPGAAIYILQCTETCSSSGKCTQLRLKG